MIIICYYVTKYVYQTLFRAREGLGLRLALWRLNFYAGTKVTISTHALDVESLGTRLVQHVDIGHTCTSSSDVH